MERVECVVIGAGVVGLAIARALAVAGREVVVLEAADAIGTETSSRNSEVIHAGIYHPTASLKARLCVHGKPMLYAFCTERGIGHRNCGKLLVATDEAEVAKLASIRKQADANGVTDLVPLDPDQVRRMEPEVRCTAALLSPSSGIVDSHGVMLACRGDAEDAGAMLAFRSPVVAGRVEDGGIVLEVGGAEPMRLACRLLVNAAGHGAWDVVRRLDGFPADRIPPRRLAKGSYYALASGKRPFSRLVYPCPLEAGAGVHVTLDLAGQVRFGPDVEWVDTLDYRVDPGRADAFYASVRRYWPALPDGALVPAYSGIRPKVSGPGEGFTDWVIEGPEAHGVSGFVNMIGIESPGLTACLAIAEHVRDLLA